MLWSVLPLKLQERPSTGIKEMRPSPTMVAFAVFTKYVTSLARCHSLGVLAVAPSAGVDMKNSASIKAAAVAIDAIFRCMLLLRCGPVTMLPAGNK
jgi:hypothetical protein